MINVEGATVTAPAGSVATLQASAAQTATNNSGTFTLGSLPTPNGAAYKGVVVWVIATAASGTPSLTVKLQDSPDGTNFADVASATTSAITGISNNRFVVSAGSLSHAATLRCVSTITGGTPSITYSIQVGGIY